jgi:dUTP pyrophosphatase
MVKVKIKKLVKGAVLPSYGHPGDAGLDFCSIENFVLGPGMMKMFSTGISMEIPEGYVALAWGKSGISSKKGIAILGGVIDAHYRGEYKIILQNTSLDDFEVIAGDKIAQVLIQPVESAEIEIVDELSETSRGEGGFGSTGGSNV